MSHIFQYVDDTLLKVAREMTDMSSHGGASKQEIKDIFTKYRGLYNPPVWYAFPNEELAQKWSSIHDSEQSKEFGDKYGEQASEEQSQMLTSILYIWCMTESDSLAQRMVDDFCYKLIKKDFYAEQGALLDDLIRRANNKIVAKKPRNKAHSEAIAIAKSTRTVFPGASLGGMSRALYEYFNKKGEKVSEDTLTKWLKKSGIKPLGQKKSTSFSLVFPEGV